MRVDPLRAIWIVYAAVLSGPVPVILAPGWPSFALGAIIGGVIGAVVLRRLELPDSVLTFPWTLAGFALPLVWLIGAFLEATTLIAFFLSPLFVGALAALIWLVAVIIAIETRKQARLDAMSTSVTFEARLPPDQRRQLRLAVGVIGVFVAVGIAVLVIIGADVSWSAFVWVPAMIPIWLLIVQGGSSREVIVADGGFVVETSIQEWQTISGAELTDEAIIVRRTDWYRSSRQFDRDDIENSDAVVEAINERAGNTSGTTQPTHSQSG